MKHNTWFPPESMMHQIGQEALGLLGGGRAVLLQLAHPLVAAGVAEYSDFQADPLSRLLRTLELMHTVVYGNHREATQALERFHAVHARIQGHLSDAAGRFPAGTAFTANDPELKFWVLATLIDTSLSTYERFIAPLTPDERDRFYTDAQVLAELFRIPEAIVPPYLDDFHHYMASMITDDTLAATHTAQRLARDVLYPDVGIVPTASAALLRFITAGTLPERFREAYGLKWNAQRQILLDGLSQSTRLLRPWVPKWIWQSPQLGGSLPRWLLWQATAEIE
jgi:uncharacterized protein (DUF2236 family)